MNRRDWLWTAMSLVLFPDALDAAVGEVLSARENQFSRHEAVTLARLAHILSASAVPGDRTVRLIEAHCLSDRPARELFSVGALQFERLVRRRTKRLFIDQSVEAAAAFVTDLLATDVPEPVREFLDAVKAFATAETRLRSKPYSESPPPSIENRLTR